MEISFPSTNLQNLTFVNFMAPILECRTIQHEAIEGRNLLAGTLHILSELTASSSGVSKAH